MLTKEQKREQSDRLREAFSDVNTLFLLENHGALTIGADVMNAYYKMETLEHFAHISLVAIQLGNLKALGKPDVQKLLDVLHRLRDGLGRREAMLDSLRINLEPIFLTSLTTAVGFLSLNFSEVPPFRDPGNLRGPDLGPRVFL